MKIEHIGILTKQLETMKNFYCTFFMATANRKYTNTSKGFESYFLCFDEGCRLELMQMSRVSEKNTDNSTELLGIAHFAISVGSVQAVKSLTNDIQNSNHKVISEPRLTGDGYFESVILDPDGNRIEITS